MNLSQVSRTAILTLIARAVASERKNALFDDPMAVRCLERLIAVASPEERNWILSRRRFYAGVSLHDALAGARRARVFDGIATRYMAAKSGCTIVNLGCGFDTRFWRIANEDCRYVEVDLPEVVELKAGLLKDDLGYELVGCSVLDASWIDRVTASGATRFLLLAEGLLMFLPEPDVSHLFRRLAERFSDSQFAFDMVPRKYLRGLWRVLLRLETTINWRLKVSWVSGFNDIRQIESYAPGIRVIGEEAGSAGPILVAALDAA